MLLFLLTQHAQPLVAESPHVSPSAEQALPANVVTDEVGRRVSVPSKVDRVVTLAPDLTETIYSLGLQQKLVGDTSYCDTPPAAKLKPHVGEPLNPSLEAVVALHPDLVLASTSINRRETVDALARLGIAVYATDPHTVHGMLDSFRRISALLGGGSPAEEFVVHLQDRLDALQTRLSDLPLVHALFVTWEDPLISIGQNTFIADALRWAGAESVILSDQNWPRISFEEVVRLQPDFIIFTSNHSGGGPTQLAELRTRPGWKGLRAVELGNVVVASDEIARPSPGMIKAIEDLAQELHPEALSPQGAKQSTNRKSLSDLTGQFSKVQAAEKECFSCGR